MGCKSLALRRLHLPSLAYSATTFASHIMAAIFNFYYVKVFLTRYKINDYWFNVAQVIFMIWNAVNDPLFGYVQDNSNWSIFRVRRLSILYGAPIYVLSFVTFWFPWATDGSWLVGLHLLFSLCLFDALLTFVLLAQCALFAEMSTAHEDRLRLVLYSQVASLIGSSSVAITEFSSSGLDNFGAFQVATLVLACVAWGGFAFTGYFAITDVAQVSAKCHSSKSDPEVAFKSSSASSSASSSILRQTWEILRQRNFLAFVFMNFLQIFHSTFHANFSSIFLDILFPGDELSDFARMLYKGSLFIMPQVLVLLLGSILKNRGAYWVVMRSFVFKMSLALILGFASHFHVLSLFSNHTRAWILLGFVMCDSAFGSAMFSTFNLFLSDIIDDDMVKNRRPSPVSSSVFGTNALITKPAQSLAPIFVIYLLNPFGFEAFKHDPKSFVQTSSQLPFLQGASLNLIWGWPFILGILQILVFRMYQLRNTHDSFVAKHMEE